MVASPSIIWNNNLDQTQKINENNIRKKSISNIPLYAFIKFLHIIHEIQHPELIQRAKSTFLKLAKQSDGEDEAMQR